MLISGNNAFVLPSPSADQRVEVVIEKQNDRSESTVALKHSTWTEGLGWCAQKTIRLDAEQLEELHHALVVARHRLLRERADNAESGENSTAKVIRLPSL